MKRSYIKYSLEELTWIKANCGRPRKESHKEFCEKFGRSEISLGNYNALCRRKGWMTGRTGCYEKGDIPLNKGKKMPYNANSAKTQFKKGRLPHNTRYLGHERVTKDGYIEISIAQTNTYTGADRRYVLKHRHLWEKKNGKVPKEMALKCLDGNRKNCSPSNWELVPRGMLPYFNNKGSNNNNYDCAPDELKPVLLTLAKIKYAKSKATKINNQ